MVNKVVNGAVQVVDVPERPWKSMVNEADYRWITLQLQYTIHYQTNFVSCFLVRLAAPTGMARPPLDKRCLPFHHVLQAFLSLQAVLL